MNNRSIKGVFIGKANVGKSSIIYQYVNNKFTDNIKSTIGASYAQIKMNNFNLDLWDTAGQEKYESLSPMYYRGSDYVFLVFDVTDGNSIHYCRRKIIYLNKILPKAVFILLGNKYDLYDNLYKENIVIANKLAEIYNIQLIYVSAKNGHNIKKIFENIKYVEKAEIENINIEMNESKKGCCIIS